MARGLPLHLGREIQQMNTQGELARRPMPARTSRWAVAAAAKLAAAGLKPNQVSVSSVVFASLAASCLFAAKYCPVPAQTALFIAAAFFIVLRLLANMFDGMLAVEGGMKSRSGAVYNELPDRLADAFILVAAGYSVGVVEWGAVMGWTAALLALLTAYIRAMGASLGTRHYFSGPMAKQHRMFVIISVSILSAVEAAAKSPGYSMVAGLTFIVIGAVVTCIRRTWLIGKELNSK